MCVCMVCICWGHCVCGYMFMCCILVSTYPPIQTRAGLWISSSIPLCLIALRQTLSLKFTILAKLAGQLALRICLALPSNDQVKCKLHALGPAFNMMLAIQIQACVFAKPMFLPLGHLLKTLTDQQPGNISSMKTIFIPFQAQTRTMTGILRGAK